MIRVHILVVALFTLLAPRPPLRGRLINGRLGLVGRLVGRLGLLGRLFPELLCPELAL